MMAIRRQEKEILGGQSEMGGQFIFLRCLGD